MGTSTELLELNKPFTTNAQEITLTQVDPQMQPTGKIKADDYIFYFRIKTR
jgi:hypothetical protein